MTIIIDRRPNPSGKSLPNRQRFVRRAKENLKEAVRKKVADSKGITDVVDGDRKVEIDGKTLKEYRFIRDPEDGIRDYVLPGNKTYGRGDDIPKPPEGGGGSGKDAGDGDDYDESFVFTLTRDEFIDILFDDLELPDLIKAAMKGEKTKRWARAGIATTGAPSNLDLVRTMRQSLGRRIALSRPKDEEIESLEEELSVLRDGGSPAAGDRITEIEALLEELQGRRAWVPFLDPIDARYRTFEERPKPITQAVMFCIMDVSGSMGEKEKDIAKRFFMLLHLFLVTKYDTVSIVFIRHTTNADEVDEHTFFYDRKSGGTLVLPALELMLKIQRDRFPLQEWNAYCAQVSDGGVERDDAAACAEFIRTSIAPAWQYFAYIEIGDDNHGLSHVFHTAYPMVGAYDALGIPHLKTKRVSSIKEIYGVFRSLFEKKQSHG